MNIPNILTGLRLVLVPVFSLIFFSEIENAMLVSFIIFLSAGLTDILDGYIARKYNMVTRWGSILDPLADKLMAITVLVSLTIKNIIPPWVLLVIGIKESLMIAGAVVLFRRDTFVAAKSYGKTATVLLYVSILTLEFIYRPLGLFLVYITVLSSLYALYKYIENFKEIPKKA